MKHTITANGIRQEHAGGLVLSQLHIGLAVGFALVACLTAFGGGVIVGMWYKASEQAVPLGTTADTAGADKPAPSQEPVSQPPEPPAQVTFYNTLTNNNVAYAPLTSPASAPTAAGGKEAAALSTAAGTPSGAKTATTAKASAPPAATGATNARKAPPAAGPTSPAPTREEPKYAKATPAARTAPSPGSTKASGQQAAAPARPSGKATGAQRPTDTAATATARAMSPEDFSVQVGSFGSSEQAERLRTSLTQKGYPARVQLSAVPGQGLRYRVRVGNYAERTAADQTAQHLTAQEQVPAIVAGKD